MELSLLAGLLTVIKSLVLFASLCLNARCNRLKSKICICKQTESPEISVQRCSFNSHTESHIRGGNTVQQLGFQDYSNQEISWRRMTSGLFKGWLSQNRTQ